MSLLEQIPCISIVLLILGLVSLYGGIRILIERKTFIIGRNPSLQKWDKPIIVRGKKNRFWGFEYIVSGILLIILAVLTYLGGF